jgi:hypothetical protein
MYKGKIAIFLGFSVSGCPMFRFLHSEEVLLLAIEDARHIPADTKPYSHLILEPDGKYHGYAYSLYEVIPFPGCVSRPCCPKSAHACVKQEKVQP